MNLTQEIQAMIDSQVRSDWIHIVENKLAEIITAQVHLIALWDSLSNPQRLIVLEEVSLEMNNILAMMKARLAFQDDEGKNGGETETIVTPVTETPDIAPLAGTFVRETDSYLILATELLEATPKTLVAALVEIAGYRDGQWHLSKLAEAMDAAKKQIETVGDQGWLEKWAKEQNAE